MLAKAGRRFGRLGEPRDPRFIGSVVCSRVTATPIRDTGIQLIREPRA
jgi:hypothetical protein